MRTTRAGSAWYWVGEDVAVFRDVLCPRGSTPVSIVEATGGIGVPARHRVVGVTIWVRSGTETGAVRSRGAVGSRGAVRSWVGARVRARAVVPEATLVTRRIPRRTGRPPRHPRALALGGGHSDDAEHEPEYPDEKTDEEPEGRMDTPGQPSPRVYETCADDQ